jgi:N-acetylmuramoyl-L-alanine amidase
MKSKVFKACYYILLLLLCLPAATVFAQPAGQGAYTVLIDPAHGGTDPGVSIDRKSSEKDITLAVALSLKKHLEGGGKGIKVQLTRTSDKTLSVSERIKMTKALNPDLMVSLHVNAGFGQEASGFEVSFPGFKGSNGAGMETEAIVKDMAKTKYLNDSVRLAQMIQRSLEAVFPRKGRGLREVPTPILSGLTIPSVAVEFGFATNKDNRDKILSKDGQKDIARSLNRGIRDYLNL